MMSPLSLTVSVSLWSSFRTSQGLWYQSYPHFKLLFPKKSRLYLLPQLFTALPRDAHNTTIKAYIRVGIGASTSAGASAGITVNNSIAAELPQIGDLGRLGGV